MDTINGAAVPPRRAQVCWVVEAGPLDASVVRNAAHATMHTWGMAALADNVAIIVNELAANAWKYRQPPIAVMLRLEESSILIEVNDAEPSTIVFSRPEELLAHGHGFTIVAALAHEIGLYADYAGKTVWARLYFHRALLPGSNTAVA